MSKLIVGAISDGSSTIGITSTSKGSAKAWVNFNGEGTVAIRDSFNVNSITDSGTGQYQINFTNAMNNANYFVVGAASLNANEVITGSTYNRTCEVTPVSTTTCSSITYAGNNISIVDVAYVGVAVFSN